MYATRAERVQLVHKEDTNPKATSITTGSESGLPNVSHGDGPFGTIAGEQRWEFLHVYVLVIADYFTRWVKLVHCPTRKLKLWQRK